MQSNFRSHRYGQILQGIEYNPRLFLYLLIAALAVIFAYQFATQVTSEWVKSAVALTGLLVVAAILTWPYQSIFIYILLSACMQHFARGETIMGLGGALVYPADVFLGAFLLLEFFRGCMRQTHIYCATDRWMAAYIGWVLICVVRGVPDYKYSAVGEAREFLHPLLYFATIHYITRAEQIPSMLKWLKWICVITVVVWLVAFGMAGFLPRTRGGFILLAVTLCTTALAVLLGRDHIARHRKAAALTLVVLVACVMLSLNRNIVLGMLLAIPFLLWIGRRYFFQAVMLIAITAAIGGFYIGWLTSQFGSEVESLFVEKMMALINPSKDPTGNWRLYSYRWEMEKIMSNPFWVLIGQSFGGYYEWYFNMMDEPIRTAPHSVYIQLWSKMGLMGLLLHLTVFGSFFRQGLSFLQRTTDRFQQSVIMILLVVIFQILIYQLGSGLPLYTWPIMAIGTILPRLWSRAASAAPDPRSSSALARGRMPGGDLLQPMINPIARARRSS